MGGTWCSTGCPRRSGRSRFNLRAEVGGNRIYLISQLFPGATPDTSHTIQNILATFEPDGALITPSERRSASR